jgi:hypothetical protein
LIQDLAKATRDCGSSRNDRQRGSSYVALYQNGTPIF